MNNYYLGPADYEQYVQQEFQRIEKLVKKLDLQKNNRQIFSLCHLGPENIFSGLFYSAFL